MNDTNNAMLAAFHAGEKGTTPNLTSSGHLAVREGFKLVDVSKELLREQMASEPGPSNPAGTLHLLTPESFVAAVRDHYDERSAVFADAENSKVVAVFDFLERGGLAGHVSEESRERGWGQHRAEIVFALSRKLKEWKKLTEPVSQLSFAEFLEDHREDVIEPTGADLLGLVTDLEASSSGSFKGRVNLSNGSCALSFTHDTETTVEVPAEIVLGIPLFEHHDAYKLRARLRWRHHQGALTFRLLFPTLQDALEQEFERIVQEMEEQVDHGSFYRGRLALPW